MSNKIGLQLTLPCWWDASRLFVDLCISHTIKALGAQHDPVTGCGKSDMTLEYRTHPTVLGLRLGFRLGLGLG